MFRNHQLRSRIAVTGVVLGASLGTAGLAGASTTPAAKLPTLTQFVSGLSALHLTPASLITASRDYRAVSTAAATPSDSGIGPLLYNLSQVKGIKGTQFGNDLSTLASESDNEDTVVYANETAGLLKLQAESAGFPAPFNELFYNLAAVLLKGIPPTSSSVTSQPATSTSTSAVNLTGTLTGILKSL